MSGGRGGDYVECVGRPVGADRSNASYAVAAGAEGKSGDIVAVAETPWGVHVVVRRAFTAWATGLLFPMVPLAGTGLCAYFALRKRDAPTP